MRVVRWREGGGGDAPVVDVGSWSRAVLGADGGPGTPLLCRTLGQEPWALDVGPGGARGVALRVELVFPDNDVTQVTARVALMDLATGAALSGQAGRAAEVAVESLLGPLRALGGTASAAAATSSILCTVRGGTSPRVARGARGAPGETR